MGVWNTICTQLASNQICAMVTILQTRGSAPREAGVRMIVLANGGFSGTIGGGALEWEAIAMARVAIAKTQTDGFGPTLHQSQQALGPDLGQCCGGSVSLLLEVIEPDRLAELSVLAEAEKAGAFETESKIKVSRVERSIIAADDPARDGCFREQFGANKQTLALFGAGHVGRALMLALAPLDFRVVWIDPRANAFPEVVPGDVVTTQSLDPVGELQGLPDDAFILVMTHSHALDFDLVSAALLERRFAYVGLIGSDTKRARFRRRLRQAGLADKDIEKMVCPIGIPGIQSKQPNAIGASVVADLLCRMEQCDSIRNNKQQSLKRAGRVAKGEQYG